MRAVLLIASLVAAAASVTGCVHVAPYEREYLASPAMDVSQERQEAAFKAHVFTAREGATGGSGATGGGCGCN